MLLEYLLWFISTSTTVTRITLLRPQAYPAASYRLVSNGPGRSNSSVRFNQALCLFTFIDLVIFVGLWCFGLYNHVIFLLRFKGHLLQDQAGFPHSHWFSVFASLSSDHRIVEAKHVSHHHKIMGFTSWMTLTLVAGSKVSIFTHRPIPFEPSFEWSWTATHQMILQRHSSSAYDPSVKVVKSSQVNPPI